MSNTAILLEAKQKLDAAVAKVNRLATRSAGESRNYMNKAADALMALDPNEMARITTDLVTAHAELLQAKFEFNTARNAS